PTDEPPPRARNLWRSPDGRHLGPATPKARGTSRHHEPATPGARQTGVTSIPTLQRFDRRGVISSSRAPGVSTREASPRSDDRSLLRGHGTTPASARGRHHRVDTPRHASTRTAPKTPPPALSPALRVSSNARFLLVSGP